MENKSLQKAISNSITKLYSEYIKYPYLHRVEHSLHCELYRIMSEEIEKNIGNRYIENRNGFITQAVHKEWPHQVGIDESIRRGNYDLTVLDSCSLKDCTLDNYYVGKEIKLVSAIELGLNYPIQHLEKDCLTLYKTRSESKWVIHFLNIKSRSKSIIKHKQAINDILEKYNDISIAYAWAILNKGQIEVIDNVVVNRNV